MNFLAHLYLSGSNVEIRLGNFIGDYVKGNRFDQYSGNIQKGIRLHRAIDTLTDSHPATHACTEIIKPGYGKYAGVVTDVLFDHVLAKSWNEYSSRNLKDSTRTFYLQMLQHYNTLPTQVRRFLPFMIQSNRLYSYQSVDGIGKALEIMSNNTSLPANTLFATQQLTANYELFKTNFDQLFADLIKLATDEFGVIID